MAIRVALPVAVIVAVYTGFRLPNLWTASLDCISLTTGFHRRFLVGTLLRPLALLTNYNYWVFATKSLLILAVLIGVLVVLAYRSAYDRRALLIVAWFMLPTGAFMVHEVGYYEQVLYLLLFAALPLLHRGRAGTAAFLMALCPLVHEISVLTVLPIFAFLAMERLPLSRVVAILAPALACNGLVLLAPRVPVATLTRFWTEMKKANFPVYPDAAGLQGRTQYQSWQMYSVVNVWRFVVPVALLLVVIFLLMYRNSARTRPAAGQFDLPRWAEPRRLIGCCAMIAPVLLSYAGYDKQRWAFLSIANFFVVTWHLMEERRLPRTRGQFAVLVTVVLVLTHVPLPYFDGSKPRDLTWPSVQTFVQDVRHGFGWRIPPA